MAESILISGATGGIGEALAHEAKNRGWHPLIGYHHYRDKAEALARDVGGSPLALDLADQQSIDAAIRQVSVQVPPLGAIVLAASPAPRVANFTRPDTNEARRQLEVNVIGPHLLLAGLIKGCLRARRRGIIVAILSRATGSSDEEPMTNMTEYVVAKSGLASLVRVAQASYPWLRVETVSPGFVETPMLRSFEPRLLESLRDRAPGGRFAEPGEIAVAICNKIGRPQHDAD